MLEGQVLSIEKLYVRLLDEGTDVLRPVDGRLLPDGKYELIAPPGYDPEYETWEYPPGSVVSGRVESRQGRQCLVAYIEQV